MAQPYVGEIRMFASNYAPTGWAFCHGQLLPISEYDVLFMLIGTTYGGDGQTNFALPDLRGRIPIHQHPVVYPDNTTFPLASMGGAEQVTLTPNQIPVHTHAMTARDHAGNQINPGGNLPGQSPNIVPYINDAPDGAFNGAAVAPRGGSQPHTNLQPYLCLSFIISLFGIFPSQT